MTENFMLVEDALDVVWDLANQNKLDEGYTQDDPDLEPERIKQELALDVVHDFMVNVVGEGRTRTLIRKPPKGSKFVTLLVAYLFENMEQFKMFDEAEGDARHAVDGESHGVVSLLEWRRVSGFPTFETFDNFSNEVALELGDIPFVDIEE